MGWSSDKSLIAKMPAGIPAGIYDVEVHDPRGNRDQLPSGFTSLGHDTEEPVLALVGLAPETLLGAGSLQPFRFQATDRLGWLTGLRWRAWTESGWSKEDDCPVTSGGPPGVTNDCPVTIRAAGNGGGARHPSSGAHRARQRPTGGEHGHAHRQLPLRAGAAGDDGPLHADQRAGIGGNVVHNRGDQLRSGTDQVGNPDPASSMPPAPPSCPRRRVGPRRSISARTLPHTAGPVTVLVGNGKKITTACTFTFLAAPIIRQVKPGTGPAAGGTRIAIAGNHFPPDAKVYLIGDLQGELVDVYWVSENRIEATMPPGRDRVAFVVDAGLPGRSVPFTGFEYDPTPDSPPPDAPPCPDPPTDDCDTGSVP